MNRREILKACAVFPFLGFLGNRRERREDRREERQSQRFRVKVKIKPIDAKTEMWMVKPRIAEYRGHADELWIVKPRVAQYPDPLSGRYFDHEPHLVMVRTDKKSYVSLDVADAKYEYIFDLEERDGVMEPIGCEVITAADRFKILGSEVTAPADRFKIVSRLDIDFVWSELHRDMTLQGVFG
jgi:hypothetical protein